MGVYLGGYPDGASQPDNLRADSSDHSEID